MKKFFLITIVMIFSGTVLFGQANKSLFGELGGNGLGFSANFDGRFKKSEKGLGFRAGVGFVPGIRIGDGSGELFRSSAVFTLPLGINYLAGSAPSFFEGGIGITYVSSDFSVFGSDEERASGVLFIPSAGYRYAPEGKGFQGRIGVTPLFGSGGAVLFFGLSAGFKF